MFEILITGTSGFSGKIITEKLIKLNFKIFILRGKKSLIKTYKNHEKVKIITLDNIKKNDFKHNINCIIHCAAQSQAKDISTIDYIESNILLTKQLINFCYTNKINKFIFLSSISIYGKIKHKILNINTPTYNPCMYGISKLVCESILSDSSYFLNSICIRLPGVIGKNSVRNWLTSIYERALVGKKIEIFNPEALFNNAIHINDLTDFVISLLEYNFIGFNKCNIGSSGKMKIIDVVNLIVKEKGNKSRVYIKSSRNNSFRISNQEAIKFGYSPRDIRETIKLFIKN